ncbi:MAG: FAD-dependent oxidoreductase [Alphaproteobacteria bacterium]|nr:FAD-dependent oxidoreductase [Alphaproteobacteria bacterium]MCB9699436.1 FAD-dependent oxidoreductase [Alphaproteobacteria bacterium]
MADIPADRSEASFEDFKPAYTKAQAVVEANRCLYCYDAPCVKACPTSIDIPEFIRKIATDNVRGSARTILESNILGMSCARVCPVEVLCVGDCVYNELGVPPIQIGKLQRFSTDEAYAAGWRFHEAGSDTGKSVGLVGGGPASLACAHRLRRFGHRVTIYEKRDQIGGLNLTGVAPYKIKADRAAEEIDYVMAIGGIDVVTGVSVPGDLSWDELRKRHDALFVGFGLGPDSILSAAGGDLPGIVGAVDWIEQMKLGRLDLSAVRSAMVVGGGNTALDVVRELRGLGVPEVALVYRGDEAVMSGYAHEWAAAKEEGVRGLFRTLPVAFSGDGKVERARLVRMDEHKRPIDGSEHEVPCDLAIVAVGQSKLGELCAGLAGVKVEKGRILVGPDQATGEPGVYAGGDCANGGTEVVNAVAEGRDAAVSIDAWLGRT